MKLILVCLFGLVALPLATKGCIYVEGKCYKECEEGTYSYGTGCGHLMPEPTCDELNPVAGDANVCDYSACYCNPPTVRDTVTKKCVKIEKCPKKE